MRITEEFKELSSEKQKMIDEIIQKNLGNRKNSSISEMESEKWYSNFMDKFHKEELEDCLDLHLKLNEDEVLKGEVLNYCELMKKSWNEINELHLFSEPNNHYQWILETLRNPI
jgi:hypothetical protein